MLNRVINPNNCTATVITYINCCSAFLNDGLLKISRRFKPRNV